MKNIKNEKRLGLFAPDYEIITGRAKKKKKKLVELVDIRKNYDAAYKNHISCFDIRST